MEEAAAAHNQFNLLDLNAIFFVVNLRTLPNTDTISSHSTHLFYFWKMINYCFQGKHEKDMKNAQDRQTISLEARRKRRKKKGKLKAV